MDDKRQYETDGQKANNLNNARKELQRNRIRDPEFIEESATEFVEKEITESFSERESKDEEIRNIYGWLAIAASVIAFFLVPIVFGALGIILGIVARRREAPILGNTAIVLSIIAVLVHLFILPLI